MINGHEDVALQELAVRRGRVSDERALVRLEEEAFDSDRFTRRNFHWMLTRANAALLVAETEGAVIGYVLVLFHAGTSLARMYSLAVARDWRRRGVAARLVNEAEAIARDHGDIYLRLEVRPDAQPAIRLFKALGYRLFSVLPEYYEDHSEALRYEKRVKFPPAGFGLAVPYYEQTTDFTCGPASLMMAMKTQDPTMDICPALELRIWREATTIFMTSGHGGCSPYGLALSAWDRGFGVRIFVTDHEVPFIDSVRSDQKKGVIRLVHEDFLNRLADTAIAIEPFPPDLSRVQEMLDDGGVPLILISSYRINREKSPHWVVLTGVDDRFVYIHDPDVDEDLDKAEIDCLNVPISRKEFDKMAQYGRSQLRAMVVVFPRGHRDAQDRHSG